MTLQIYYHEDQLALSMAVAAGMFDIIRQKITSPSTFFDNLIVTNFVSLKEESMKVDSGAKPYVIIATIRNRLVNRGHV